jgi:hypothetical protein
MPLFSFFHFYFILVEMIILTGSGWEGQWHGYIKRRGIVRIAYPANRRRDITIPTIGYSKGGTRKEKKKKRFNWVASRQVFMHARNVFRCSYCIHGFGTSWGDTLYSYTVELYTCARWIPFSHSLSCVSLLNTLEMDETRRHAYSTPREN